MAKLTKKQFEDVFREEVLPYVVERYERDGVPDKPARREAWNEAVDAYMRDRRLPEAAGNWGHPRWLETYRPRSSSRQGGRSSHSTKLNRADDLIANYGTWTSSYSNEDLDRASSLANRLTDIDRQEGHAAPPVGFSKQRYEQAKRVVADANNYGEKQQKLRAGRSGTAHARATKRTYKSSGTYTVHGHMQRRDGRQEAFWTRTGLSKSAADKLAREQRQESGGVARVVAENGRASHATKRASASSEAWSAGGGLQHASVKTPAQLDREIAQLVGPSAGTWKKSDQPFNSEHLDIGNASARVKPTSTYSGSDYEWTIWIGPSGRRVLHQSGETRTKAAAKRAAERKLAALRQ